MNWIASLCELLVGIRVLIGAIQILWLKLAVTNE